VLDYVPGGWIGESCMVHDAHLFVLPNNSQAGLELAAMGRNGTKFSQYSAVWGGFPQATGS
jgi:hypothetical protein